MIEFENEIPLIEPMEKEVHYVEDQFKIFMSACELTEKELNMISNFQDKEKIIKMYDMCDKYIT
jgi:hypothetical protein